MIFASFVHVSSDTTSNKCTHEKYEDDPDANINCNIRLSNDSSFKLSKATFGVKHRCICTFATIFFEFFTTAVRNFSIDFSKGTFFPIVVIRDATTFEFFLDRIPKKGHTFMARFLVIIHCNLHVLSNFFFYFVLKEVDDQCQGNERQTNE